MGKETYSIPAGLNARYDLANNVINLAIVKATAWNIPADIITNLTSLLNDYEQKNSITSNRNIQNPAATAAREASWVKLEMALIELYNYHLLYNDAISMEDKEALHIHQIISKGKISAPAPSTTPIVTLTAEEISMLRVVYSDSSAPGTHYKPDNVSFCEVWYKVDVPAPITPEECPESSNISRSHEAIVFTPLQRGKTIYAFARWVNRNGKVGPWSGQFSAIVP